MLNKVLKLIVVSSVFLSPLATAQDDSKAFDLTNLESPKTWRDMAELTAADARIYFKQKQKEEQFILAAKALMASHQSFGDVLAEIEFVEDKQESIFDIKVSITQQYPATGAIKIGNNVLEAIKTESELKGLAAFALTKLSAVRTGLISWTGRYPDERSKQADFKRVVLLAGARLERGPSGFPVNYENLKDFFEGQDNQSALMILATTKKSTSGKDVKHG